MVEIVRQMVVARQVAAVVAVRAAVEAVAVEMEAIVAVVIHQLVLFYAIYEPRR